MVAVMVFCRANNGRVAIDLADEPIFLADGRDHLPPSSPSSGSGFPMPANGSLSMPQTRSRILRQVFLSRRSHQPRTSQASSVDSLSIAAFIRQRMQALAGSRNLGHAATQLVHKIRILGDVQVLDHVLVIADVDHDHVGARVLRCDNPVRPLPPAKYSRPSRSPGWTCGRRASRTRRAPAPRGRAAPARPKTRSRSSTRRG